MWHTGEAAFSIPDFDLAEVGALPFHYSEKLLKIK
jgi:hypothetical protein